VCSWVFHEDIKTFSTHLIGVGVAWRLYFYQIVVKSGDMGRDLAILETMSWIEHRPIPCVKLSWKGPQITWGYQKQSGTQLLWFWHHCDAFLSPSIPAKVGWFRVPPVTIVSRIA
jgi:hypothetical protein